MSILGVCRDEMMFPMEHALHDVWGPAFDMSSLAAMVFLGRSGLSAAAHHEPGADGRKRFVNVVMPHIGLDSDGAAGVVMRAGQIGPSTACGALIGLLARLPSGRDRASLGRSARVRRHRCRSVLVCPHPRP